MCRSSSEADLARLKAQMRTMMAGEEKWRKEAESASARVQHVESEMRQLLDAMDRQKAASSAKMLQLSSVLKEWNVLP